MLLQVDDVTVTNTCPNDTILMRLFIALVQNRIPNQVIENELSDIFVVMALLLHRHTDIARLKSLEVIADDIKKAKRQSNALHAWRMLKMIYNLKSSSGHACNNLHLWKNTALAARGRIVPT